METIRRVVGGLTDHRASRTDRRTYLAATISLVGVGTFMVGVLLLHLLKRDLNPAQHLISEYALGSFGWIQTMDFLAVGIGTIALALALRRAVKNPGRIAPILIGLWGVAALLVAFVPTDGPGRSHLCGWFRPPYFRDVRERQEVPQRRGMERTASADNCVGLDRFSNVLPHDDLGGNRAEDLHHGLLHLDARHGLSCEKPGAICVTYPVQVGASRVPGGPTRRSSRLAQAPRKNESRPEMLPPSEPLNGRYL
jgi:hypothetical protein